MEMSDDEIEETTETKETEDSGNDHSGLLDVISTYLQWQCFQTFKTGKMIYTSTHQTGHQIENKQMGLYE